MSIQHLVSVRNPNKKVPSRPKNPEQIDLLLQLLQDMPASASSRNVTSYRMARRTFRSSIQAAVLNCAQWVETRQSLGAAYTLVVALSSGACRSPSMLACHRQAGLLSARGVLDQVSPVASLAPDLHGQGFVCHTRPHCTRRTDSCVYE